jgi:peptidoglycan hydrolase-like protein with peptidoglycan-binding domain
MTVRAHVPARPDARRTRRAPAPTRPAGPTGLLALQRTIGNAAVTRLVAGQRRRQVQRATDDLAEVERPVDDIEDASPARPAPAKAGGGGLKLGSSGPAVAQAQEQLNGVGATPRLDPDGRFGPRTDAAVRFFQRSHNLAADGIIGPFTKSMLGTELALHGEPARREPCHTPDEPGPDSGFEDPGPRPEPLVLGLADGGDVRQGKPGAVRVVVLLANDPSEEKRASNAAEMAAFGGIQERAFTIADLEKVIAKHPNIETLALLSHGTPQGEIFVGNTLVKLSALAAQLTQRSGGSIGSIVFLGCSVGNDGAGLDAIKQRLGGSRSEGATCNLRTKVAGPLTTADGKRQLTSVDAIIAAGQADPIGAIRRNAKKLMEGTQRTGCIFGFAPADSIDSVRDEVIRKAYDDHRGTLTAKFTTNGCETCYENLKFDKPDDCGCKRTQR